MEDIILSLSSLFKWIITSSLMASLLVGIIVLLTFILKDFLTVKWHYGLWFIMMIRLLMPRSLQTSFSLFNIFSLPDFDAVTVTNNSGYSAQIVKELSNSLPAQPDQLDATVIEISSSFMNESSLFMILLGLWIMGVLLFAGYIVVKTRRFSQTLKYDAFIQHHEIIDLFEQCKRKVGIRNNIRLVKSTLVETPALYGLFRPKILIPANRFEEFSLDEYKFIFLHELVHFKRKDLFVNSLMTSLLVLHWFNPILWYAYNRMREDQELSCDATTISYLQSSEVKGYGYTIIKLLSDSSTSFSLPATATFATNKSQLKRRILMIKTAKKHSLKWSLLGLLSLMLVGCVSLTDAQEPNSMVVTKPNVQEVADKTEKSQVEYQVTGEGRFEYQPTGKDHLYYYRVKNLNEVITVDDYVSSVSVGGSEWGKFLLKIKVPMDKLEDNTNLELYFIDKDSGKETDKLMIPLTQEEDGQTYKNKLFRNVKLTEVK